MSNIVYISEDLVRVKRDNSSEKVILAWGDPVEVLKYDKRTKRTKIRVHDWSERSFTGTVSGKLKTRKTGILKFSMVDVQQGDAMILETPKGKKLFIDGGENKLFARHVAARYHNHTKDKPLDVDAIVVTHGDADHCIGFNSMVASETDRRRRKRAFIRPHRILHNGLVKGPSSKGVLEIFGETVPSQGGHYVIDLEDDISTLPKKRMNRNFKRWVKTIEHWQGVKYDMIIDRLEAGVDDAFDFLKDDKIEVKVLGPITEKVTTPDGDHAGLPIFKRPLKTVLLPLDPKDKRKKPALSASHTINGNSVVLRVKYGNVRFLLSGDSNQESMKRQLEHYKNNMGLLECDILKVPHHGSGDFDLKALKAFAPVVSLISCGDESSRTEYIHPRATLMGALGRAARSDPNLVLCTELVAFFEVRGYSIGIDKLKKFFGFERTNYGMIQVRTDGERVLVFTHSGKKNLMEAYRFTVNDKGDVKFAKNVKKR